MHWKESSQISWVENTSLHYYVMVRQKKKEPCEPCAHHLA